jgi:hypothetical protein
MQNRLSGQEKIVFGSTKTSRKNVVNGILALPIFLGSAFELSHNATILAFLVPSTVAALGSLLSIIDRNSLEISFVAGAYFIESGSWPAVRVTGGPLREISHIAITKDLQFPEFSCHMSIEFHPEVKRPPFRIDNLLCSVATSNFKERVALSNELATRLNVPLFDDSGWNGWLPKITEPEMIVVQPGETHPVLLRPPPKWNKW